MSKRIIGGMEKDLGGGKVLRLVQGDITSVETDAIANAANAELRGGGGVDGAIHRAGGPTIKKELEVIRAAEGGCQPGSAVATTAGRLPAKYVFHAVGPIYRDGEQGEPRLLASCYRTCLELANERGVKKITFPSISTGVYGYPVDDAAAVALKAVTERLDDGQISVEEVVFVLFDQATFDAYRRALAAL